MANKWITLETFAHALTKIKALFDTKANIKHDHKTSDIQTTNNAQFVNNDEKIKISTIINNGDGKGVLHNDGKYKPLSGVETIDDNNISIESTYSSDKVVKELNNKSNINHIHQSLENDRHTHDNRTVLDSVTQKSVDGWNIKTNIIQNTGDGKKVLLDSGIYTELPLVALKGIINNGNGDMVLYNDGTYKRPSNIISITKNEYTSLRSAGEISGDILYIITDDSLLYYGELLISTGSGGAGGGSNITVINRVQYDDLINKFEVDENTLYYIKDELSIYKGFELLVDGYKKNKPDSLSFIINNGNGEKVLSNDGSYKQIPFYILDDLTNQGIGDKFLSDNGRYMKVSNLSINDDEANATNTYSSFRIEERIINAIDNLVLPSQNDAPSFWQKTYLNVEKNDILEIVTSDNFKMDKLIVQPYKFIAGEKGIVEVLKDFDNGDKDNFIYNEENVVFENGRVKIKDKFNLKFTYNKDIDCYESEIINVSDFVDNHIRIEIK